MKNTHAFFWPLTMSCCFLFFLGTTTAAHEKVVVIPLKGSQKITNNTSPCNSSAAGLIRWTGDDFEGCDGSHWGRFLLIAKVPTVISEGRIWMDRNLGASRAATSSIDSLAYGDLYQWGRLADGHQNPTSPTTPDLSSTDVPPNGNFITPSFPPYDWRTPKNDNLWQGLKGINNPCPSGFRIPTQQEWETELASWSSNDAAGALASPLKLVLSGFRNYDGTLNRPLFNAQGIYWSSPLPMPDLFRAFRMNFDSDSASAGRYDTADRGMGYSVRCIQD